MNPDSQDFKQLRQLLALKRHEQPPPGYFHHFSREVIVRIKTGDSGEKVPSSWIERLWAMLEAKPIFAGALGASVCAVLISGFVNAEETAGVATATGLQPLPSGGHGGFTPGVAMASADALSADEPTLNTSPAEASLESLFEFRPGRLNALPANNWVVPAN
ncbi:MAG TPA: hypothetical protein VEH04_06820 [Verrucomicrobiae bacterium]|nr:hypothetical protein [Verrucomicrobiae bacterium]